MHYQPNWQNKGYLSHAITKHLIQSWILLTFFSNVICEAYNLIWSYNLEMTSVSLSLWQIINLTGILLKNLHLNLSTKCNPCGYRQLPSTMTRVQKLEFHLLSTKSLKSQWCHRWGQRALKRVVGITFLMQIFMTSSLAVN